jgi:FKBP-type peptidyl-prolyl cis-trans isomerase
MATSTAQRTGIWIIAIVLTVGTIAGFIAMILAPQNQAKDSAQLQALYTKYQNQVTEVSTKQGAQQTDIDAQAEALSSQYFAEFNSYSNKVGKFDKAEAEKKLASEDLKAGTGEEITADTTYAVYYLGWLPDGTIFDGSIDGSKLKSPLIARPGGTIAGWSKGVVGMKIGGVRMLTIPSEQGYGASGQGKIPANSPLKFIIMPIKKLETIKQPEVPKELIQSYGG